MGFQRTHLSVNRSSHKLIIASCNLMKAHNRLNDLLSETRRMRNPFHVICLQDPPPTVSWSVRSSNYELWYGDEAELAPEDHPFEKQQAAKLSLKRSMRKNRSAKGKAQDRAADREALSKKHRIMKSRVAFLVSEVIKTSDWRVEPPDDDNDGLVATLRLRTQSGPVAIHNVYNHYKAINIDQLMEICPGKGREILTGDFNLHHQQWCGDQYDSVVEHDASLMSNTLQAAGMKLFTSPGAITYSRSPHEDRLSSTIDLTFGSASIAMTDPQWKIVDVPGFESDHRVTQLSLRFDIDESIKAPRPDWKNADKAFVREAAQKALQSLDGMNLDSPEATERYSTDMVKLLHAVVSKTIPLTKPPASSPDFRKVPHIREAYRKAEHLLRTGMPNIGAHHGHGIENYHTTQRYAERLVYAAKRSWFRQFCSKNAENSIHTFRIAKAGKRMRQPRTIPYLKGLVVNETMVTSTPEVSQAFRDHLWPDTDDQRATPIPRPPIDKEREQYTASQTVTLEEFDRLIAKLKTGKAAGIDGVANDLLKMIREVIRPYLHRLFQACISLGHVPTQFREARTVVLRKPDKSPSTAPSSWRPIALLSTIGKLLEAVIANRLRQLNAENNILPANQYGAPGKCTTQALRALLRPVYDAWCQGLCATLLGLDIRGAYDRVKRSYLLEILAQKKIPDWIIQFIWSFLST